MTDTDQGHWGGPVNHEPDRRSHANRPTRACPDCGRPQHYTGTEHGWAHDALIDTWHCADPRKGISDYRRGVEDGADPRVF